MGPIPNYLVLHDWARLRLLRGLATGDLKDAIEEVRHLAWLSFHSGALIGPLIATNMIQHEQKVFDAAAPAARKGWTPTPAEDVQRLKRVSKFSVSFRPAALPVALSQRIRGCAPAAALPCSVDVEDAATLAYVRPVLAPYEPAQYERFEESILPAVAAPCAGAARAAWASQPVDLNDVWAITGDGAQKIPGARIPFLRGYTGKVLLAGSVESAADGIELLYAPKFGATPAP